MICVRNYQLPDIDIQRVPLLIFQKVMRSITHIGCDRAYEYRPLNLFMLGHAEFFLG